MNTHASGCADPKLNSPSATSAAAAFSKEWEDASFEKGETTNFYHAYFDGFGAQQRNAESQRIDVINSCLDLAVNNSRFAYLLVKSASLQRFVDMSVVRRGGLSRAMLYNFLDQKDPRQESPHDRIASSTDLHQGFPAEKADRKNAPKEPPRSRGQHAHPLRDGH